MELIHKLNNVTIEEPVGFDNLECKIHRGDYHGMSAEVSVGTLEFYGKAYGTIKAAYDHDIDSILTYSVTTDTGVQVYIGALDLSTCSFQDSEYRSVSVKVGEVGIKTTFNNRTETEVDLGTDKTIDGLQLEKPEWKSLAIPQKHLLYTNGEKQDATKLIEKTLNNPWGWNELTAGWSAGSTPHNYQYFQIPMGEVYAEEFGEYQQVPDALQFYQIDDADQQWSAGEEYEKKYGTDTTIHVEWDLKANVINKVKWNPTPSSRISFYIAAQTTTGQRIASQPVTYTAEELNVLGEKKDISMKLEGDLPGGTAIWFYLQVNIGQPYTFHFNLEVGKGSKLKMTMYDNLPDTNVEADMILAHDALNVVAKAISENGLSVKSEWYGSTLSKWNATSVFGGGSLKALTNGYRIRGLFSTDEDKRNMPVSFRTMIESLDAQDCIGWGFSEEGGKTYVRVERWNWFYRDNTILTINGANAITREVDASKVATELTIGYRKYATNDQYHSIDSIHGQRTFTSGIKAVRSALERTCDFVADNYAIEETRRARTNKNETEETSYDESIFVFELVHSLETKIGGQERTYIGHTATDAQNIGRGQELINAKLSPRHMAARWRSYLFSTATHSDLRFTSGEINYSGQFGVIPEQEVRASVVTNSLKTENENAIQKEDDNITNAHAIIKAETLSFEYPLTIAQYKAVKDDPYGLVIVNGIPGWIQEVTYRVNDGLAAFKLIPKYIG